MSHRQDFNEDLAYAAAAPAATNGGGGWGRRLLLWLAGGAVALAALGGGIGLGWWLFYHIVVTIHIKNQATGIVLPERFSAVAEVTNQLDVAMKGEISTAVPFNQDLIVPFRGRYDFDVEMAAQVPVAFEVVYDGILPVDTQADVTIRTGINYKNLKALRNLKIETTLPLQFPLPVKLQIPVEDVIDLTYAGPLSAEINQDVKTRVNTVLRTRLPIDQTISTPVTAALPLEIRPDQDQVRLLLADLLVELRPSTMLKFSLPEDREGPTRVESPWGPDDTGGRAPRERESPPE